MKFIEIETRGGESILVNPNQVTKIKKGEGMKVHIFLGQDEIVTDAKTAQEIADKLCVG